MVIPTENHKILTDIKRVDRFDFGRPAPTATRINIVGYRAAKYILEDQTKYRVCWEEGLKHLMGEGGGRFMLSGDTELHAQQRKCMGRLLYNDTWRNAVKSFYATTAEKLIERKSYKLAGKTQVDVVRDVGNVAHTHFVSRMFNLPLKTEENPKGIFSEQELYKILAVIFVCIFFDIDPAKSFPLRQGAREVAQALGKIVEMNVKLATSVGVKGLFTAKPDKTHDPLAAYGENMAKGLKKAGLSTYDIVWSQILPTAGAMVPNQAQVVSSTFQVVACVMLTVVVCANIGLVPFSRW